MSRLARRLEFTPGRQSDAVTLMRQIVLLAERLAAEYSDRWEYRDQLGESYGYLGDGFCIIPVRLKEALGEFRKSFEILDSAPGEAARKGPSAPGRSTITSGPVRGSRSKQAACCWTSADLATRSLCFESRSRWPSPPWPNSRRSAGITSTWPKPRQCLVGCWPKMGGRTRESACIASRSTPTRGRSTSSSRGGTCATQCSSAPRPSASSSRRPGGSRRRRTPSAGPSVTPTGSSERSAITGTGVGSTLRSGGVTAIAGSSRPFCVNGARRPRQTSSSGRHLHWPIRRFTDSGIACGTSSFIVLRGLIWESTGPEELRVLAECLARESPGPPDAGGPRPVHSDVLRLGGESAARPGLDL